MLAVIFVGWPAISVAQYSAASDHDQHQPGPDPGAGRPRDGGELPGAGPRPLHPPHPPGPQHPAALAQ